MFESLKPYKKENYDNAEVEAELATHYSVGESRRQNSLNKRWPELHIDRLLEIRALKKLEDLKSKAHSEGLALEARHDKLMENLHKAQEELGQFRQTELGMSEDIEDEVDETVLEKAE